ncbi:MAG TPA: RodZ domain-containing protein [Burkholderiales bacterium]|nr:RodZ domain-containing protein [Burkholderiales bacterium]
MSDNIVNDKMASIGGVLSAARQRQGLSVADVARQLKLAVRQIEALEADDYRNLPRMNFVRGFIRNYARLLQIDAEPLLKPTGQLVSAPQIPEPGQGAVEIPTASGKKSSWRSYAVFLLFAALGLMFLSYEWYREQRAPRTEQVAKTKSPATKTQAAAAEPRPASPENTATPGNATSPANPTSRSSAAVPAPATSAPAREPVSEVKSVAQQTRSGEIRLEFDEESWVEITDKDGKTIFSQLSPAGSTQTVRGAPPLSMVIGNAVGVRLSYNDKPVDLQPYTKVDVARITLK